MAADGGERRPELVGDGHQELPLQLFGLRESRRHLAEPLSEVADLVSRGHVRHDHVVPALRHLVGGAGETQDRLRDPP